MQKTTRLQRLLAVVVAVFMAVCCLPLNAFAADETYLVDFVFHVGNNVGGEYLDDWEKKGVEVEACNGLTLTELLKKASVPVPKGYELAAPDQKYDINAACTIDVEVKKTETKPFRGMEAIMPSPSSGCCIR